MKYRSSIITLLLILTPLLCSSAINNKEDSLKQNIRNAANDSIKVELLLELSKTVFRSQPDNAIKYSDEAIKLAKKIDHQKGLGYALKNKGLAYYMKSDFAFVIRYWEESLNIFKEMEFKPGISNLMSNLGAVYFSKGDDPKALDYYFGSLRIAEEIKDSTQIATVYSNIGAVYANNEVTFDQSLDSYSKALKINEKQEGSHEYATTSMNIGEIYMKKGETKLALKYFNSALTAFKKNEESISRVLNFIGQTYFKKNELNTAIKYFNDALKNAIAFDSKTDISKAYISLGKAYNNKKDHINAIESFNNSLEISEKAGLNFDKKEDYLGLSEAYSQIGNYKKAFEYHTLYNDIIEVIRSEKYHEDIGNLRFKFDLESKEKEIAILNKDNALKEAEIQRVSIFRNFLYALAGFLLIIAAGVSFQYRYAKKSNKLLAEERNRAENILLNILPKDTATELKEKGFVKTRKFEQTTVLFTDFKEFSRVAERISPEDLVKSVDYYFKKFDEIVGKHNLEKIKTIGDAYMCAGGLPVPNASNAEDALNAALDILNFIRETKENPPPDIHPFDIRIGLNTGPVVAGVVGTKKFQYDIWGKTVNVAARMESNSVPGKINISDNTYQILKEKFGFSYRGEIQVKNEGKMKMYFVGEKNS